MTNHRFVPTTVLSVLSQEVSRHHQKSSKITEFTGNKDQLLVFEKRFVQVAIRESSKVTRTNSWVC